MIPSTTFSWGLASPRSWPLPDCGVLPASGLTPSISVRLEQEISTRGVGGLTALSRPAGSLGATGLKARVSTEEVEGREAGVQDLVCSLCAADRSMGASSSPGDSGAGSGRLILRAESGRRNLEGSTMGRGRGWPGAGGPDTCLASPPCTLASCRLASSSLSLRLTSLSLRLASHSLSSLDRTACSACCSASLTLASRASTSLALASSTLTWAPRLLAGARAWGLNIIWGRVQKEILGTWAPGFCWTLGRTGDCVGVRSTSLPSLVRPHTLLAEGEGALEGDCAGRSSWGAEACSLGTTSGGSCRRGGGGSAGGETRRCSSASSSASLSRSSRLKRCWRGGVRRATVCYYLPDGPSPRGSGTSGTV